MKNRLEMAATSKMRRGLRDEFEIGAIFDRMVKGMRDEMSIALWKIERSRDLAPEAIKYMMKNGLESMDGAVEKVMNGVSDGLVGERKQRELEERRREERILGMEAKIERDGKRMAMEEKKMEEKILKLEKEIECERREREHGRKKEGARMTALEGRMDGERNDREKISERVEQRMRKVEETLQSIDMESIKGLERKLEKEDRERNRQLKVLKDQVEGIEERNRNERKERDRIEEEMQREIDVRTAKDSEKDMERKVGAAMEEIKIINLDFGRKCENRKELANDAVMIIQENVKLKDRKEWEWIMKRLRVFILGKGTTGRKEGEEWIHTVPILICCRGLGDKERLEGILRKAGIRVSFQWPKEAMEYVKGVRERVQEMGFSERTHFVRVRPVVRQGLLVIRADVKRKEGGQFKTVAYWRCPPLTRDLWDLSHDILKPDWVVNTGVE